MPITFNCACGQKFRARDEQAGKRAKCPGCGQLIVVPKPASLSPAGDDFDNKPPPTRKAETRQPSKKSGGTALWIALAAGVLVVIAASSVGVWLLFFRGNQGGGSSDGEQIEIVMVTFFGGDPEKLTAGHLDLFAYLIHPIQDDTIEREAYPDQKLDEAVAWLSGGGSYCCRLALAADPNSEKEWTILLLGPAPTERLDRIPLGAGLGSKGGGDIGDPFSVMMLTKARPESVRAFLRRCAEGVQANSISVRVAKTPPLISRQAVRLRFETLTKADVLRLIPG